MNYSVSLNILTKSYTLLIVSAFLACFYVFFKPGITEPIYPKAKMDQVLSNIKSTSLVSTSNLDFDKQSSERKLSPIYTYIYDDGSKVLATLVRVKKRDDFKIETYGLLTKNIDPIYLKNSSIINSMPASISGLIGNHKYIQTCIIPKSINLSEVDFRLNNLTSTVERLNPRSKNFFDKITGNRKSIDYSCLVLTYKPSKKTTTLPADWSKIVSAVQQALSS